MTPELGFISWNKVREISFSAAQGFIKPLVIDSGWLDMRGDVGTAGE